MRALWRAFARSWRRWWAPGWPPLELYVFTVVLTLVSVTGCAGSLEAARPRTLGATAAPPSARCAELDDRRTFAGGVGKSAAILAGASGLSMLPLEGDKYEAARIGVAAGGIAAAAIAAGAVYVTESAGTSWARECAER